MIPDLKRNPTWSEVECASDKKVCRRIRYRRIKDEMALNDRLLVVADENIAKVRAEIDAEQKPSEANKIAIENAEAARFDLTNEREELNILLGIYSEIEV